MSSNSHCTIRSASKDDAEGIARVQIDSWRDTYMGIIPDDYLTSMNYQTNSERWNKWLDHSHLPPIVAESPEGKIVGFAFGGKEREGDHPEEGEVYAIYLLPDWKGHGIGKALMKGLATTLHETGYNSLFVWVLVKNLSRGFYEKMGGTEVRRKIVEIGGKELEEVGYWWADIAELT